MADQTQAKASVPVSMLSGFLGAGALLFVKLLHKCFRDLWSEIAAELCFQNLQFLKINHFHLIYRRQDDPPPPYPPEH